MHLGSVLGFTRPARAVAQNVPVLFSFTSATPSIPAGWTYYRGDTVGTYQDAAGKLQAAGASTPRFVYGSGLRMEAARTNLCANYNCNPVDLTGLTAGGDASAVLSIVADTGNLLRNALWSNGLAVDLTGICTNGKLVRLSNVVGSTPAYIEFTGSPVDTNGHSASIFAVVSGGTGTGAQVGFGAVTARTNIPAGTVLTHCKLENFTPDSTSGKMRVWVNPGFTLLCALNQLEEGGNASSVIMVAGAQGVRQADKLADAAIATRSYFNASEGAVMVDVMLDDITNHPTQHFVCLGQGTGLTNCLSVYLLTGRSKLKTRTAVNSTAQYAGDLGSVDKTHAHFPAGFTWKGSNAVIVSGALDNTSITMTGPVTGINRLDLCGRAYADSMNGILRKVMIFKKQPTMAQLGKYCDFSNDWAVPTFGQSNLANNWNAPDDNGNAGEKAWIATLDQYYPARRNWLMHSAVSGTSVTNPGNPSGWWRDAATGNFGPIMARALDMMAGFKAGGGRFYPLHSNQGEADSGSSTAIMSTAWQSCWGRIQSVIGPVPIGIECTGRRQDSAGSDGGYQILRELEQSLASTMANSYLCPERFIQPMGTDVVHETDAGYGMQAPIHARKMLSYTGVAVGGPVDGPQIAYAGRSGTTVTVALAMPAGITDFTPLSGPNGLRFFDNVTEIAVTFTKTSATQFTLTLASAPTSGIETLYYGYGVMYGVDYTKLIRGNDAYQLPLRAFHVSLPYGTAPAPPPSGFSSGFSTGFH